jgi:hypothetical protein
MQIVNRLDIKTVLTVNDVSDGDVFIFLSGEYEKDIFIATDTDWAIRLEDGCGVAYHEVRDYPIQIVKARLVIE